MGYWRLGMNTLINDPMAESINFTRNNMNVLFKDGRKLSVPLAFFPRLMHATPEQREDYIISGSGIGLHWEKLDEDISVKYLLMGVGDQTTSARFQNLQPA